MSPAPGSVLRGHRIGHKPRENQRGRSLAPVSGCGKRRPRRVPRARRGRGKRRLAPSARRRVTRALLYVTTGALPVWSGSALQSQNPQPAMLRGLCPASELLTPQRTGAGFSYEGRSVLDCEVTTVRCSSVSSQTALTQTAEATMGTRLPALLATCVLVIACQESAAPAPRSFVGEWLGQGFGGNIDLFISAATLQSVSGRIAFSANLSSGGCGSTTPADSIRQGQFYRDSLVFRIPTAAGVTPSTLRARVRRSADGLLLAIEAEDEIPMVTC